MGKLLDKATGVRIAEAIERLGAESSAVPQWDSEAGEFTQSSIVRWLDANRDGKLYGVE